MANRTDVSTIKLFGSNPQYLISNIIRSKIYDSLFWKEKCFALTAESLIDLAISLKYVGGTYGGNRKPTPFLCLVLKLLQIQPDKEIIYEYIKNEEFIYLRALGCFYLRLVGKSVDVYQHLEPLLADYRKIRVRLTDGKFEKMYMDEFVDNCLILNNFLDVDFPSLTKRQILEENQLLKKRASECYQEFLDIKKKEQQQKVELEKKEGEQKAQAKKDDIEKGEKNSITNSYSTSSYSERYDNEMNREKKKHHTKEEEREKIRRREDERKKIRRREDEKKKHRHRDRDKDRDKQKYSLKKKHKHSKKYKEKDRKRKGSSRERSSKRRTKSSSEESTNNKLYEKRNKKKKKHKHYDNQHNTENEKEKSGQLENEKTDKNSVEEWNKIREKLGMKPLK